MTRPYVSRLRIRPGALAALAVALAPLAYFYPATGRLVISPDDGVIFNVPLREAAARILLGGSLPLWNPYVFCGMPLHAAAQGGLLFPLNWFYLAFSTPAATNLMMLSTYSAAGIGAFLYARRSGSDVAGSLVTGLTWQFSAFMVCQIGHTNVAQTAACLPWVLWAVEGYGATGSRRRGVLLAALVALQSFAGHQQTFAYSLLLAAAYSLVLARARAETRGRYLRSLALVAAGVLLSAVQIVPTFELLRNSPRVAASYDFFTSFSMPRRFLLTLFAPFLSGGGDSRLFRAPYVGPAFFGEYVAYVGLVALVLAVLAFVLKPDARTCFWVAAALVALALALGGNAPLGLYHVIYYAPVLNLFRVPARHLLEAEFALAVLAGRGLTAVAARRGETKTVRRALAVGACVFLLTCLVVTAGRPTDFRLGRVAEVGLMRAPELFLPVAFAFAGAWAVWAFARARRRGAVVLVVALVALDLVVWGQSSGWRGSSPKFDSDLWGEPPTVRYLRELESQRQARGDASQESAGVDASATQTDGKPYRILTEDQPFDPSLPVPPNTPGGRWVPELQPDVYEMYGVENAAGYDGFGLSRYSRLAGDMKVWGELTDPERTLRGASRELDLLNVRYLLTRPIAGADAGASNSTNAASNPTNAASNSTTSHAAPTNASSPAAPDVEVDFPAAREEFGGRRFASEDLGLSALDAGARLSFVLPPVEADGVALLTNLSWSVNVPDGAVVARVRLFAEGGRSFDFDLRAGEHTSDWAYDRADLRTRIRHRRAPLATSYEVEDARGRYEAHTYVSSFRLPERVVVTGGEIEVARLARAPDLTLGVTRVALFEEGGRSYPLRREWVSKEPASAQPEPQTKQEGQTTSQSGQAASAQAATPGQSPTRLQTREQLASKRWRRLARLGDVAVFENTRALPRAWLASDARVLPEEEMLGVIRTGRLPEGGAWEPSRTALVEAPLDFRGDAAADPSALASVVRREPNRVEVKTTSAAPSILVLSENHYPGWRAYVDGRAAETLRVDYGLRGVVLAAGEHRVEFVYRPKSLMIGLAVSLATLAALLLWSSRAASVWLARRLRPGGAGVRKNEEGVTVGEGV